MKKLFFRVISIVIRLLFPSCVILLSACEYAPAEYAPGPAPDLTYSNIVLDGTVTDINDVPINNIKIYLNSEDVTAPYTVTDVNGHWSMDEELVLYHVECQLIVKDIDGDLNNGKFTDATIDVNLDQTGINSFEKTNIEIKLEEE